MVQDESSKINKMKKRQKNYVNRLLNEFTLYLIPCVFIRINISDTTFLRFLQKNAKYQFKNSEA